MREKTEKIKCTRQLASPAGTHALTVEEENQTRESYPRLESRISKPGFQVIVGLGCLGFYFLLRILSMCLMCMLPACSASSVTYIQSQCLTSQHPRHACAHLLPWVEISHRGFESIHSDASSCYTQGFQQSGLKNKKTFSDSSPLKTVSWNCTLNKKLLVVSKNVGLLRPLGQLL